MRGECGGKQFQQLRMAWRIVGREVVRRINQADSEHLRPQAIDRSLGEIGVFSSDHPVGQQLTGATGLCRQWPGPIEKNRSNTRFGPRNLQLPAIGHLANRCQKTTTSLAFHPRKECRKAPEVVLLPVVEWVVMTLSTLDTNSQKCPSRAGGQVLGFDLLGLVERQRRGPISLSWNLPRIPRRGQWHGHDLADHLRVAGVIGQLLTQPGLEGGNQDPCLRISLRLGQQGLSPDVGEMDDVE